MKKITLALLVMLAFCWHSNAQFTESFDTEIPATWTVLNEDGGTYTWEYVTNYPQAGAGHARIHWESAAHQDYLISPQFTATIGTSDRVNFYAGIDGTTFTETFEVRVSTTGTAAADFTDLIASETAATNASAGNYTLYSYDLSAYDGSAIYVAIVATDTDRFYLAVDEFSVDAAPTDTLDYLNLQWPPTLTFAENEMADQFVYAQAYEAGLTDVTAGQSPGIEAWIGYSSTDTDPSGAGWTWEVATFNTEVGNNDEYAVAMQNIGLAEATYYYASRFRLNGGPFGYGGILADGSNGGTWDGTTNISGVLTVTAPVANPGDNCANPIVVMSLPYNTSDDTANYSNEYGNGDSSCSSFYLSGNDVVYTYTPSADMNIKLDLSGLSATYSGIHVLDSCPTDVGANCVGFAGNSASTDRSIDVSVVNGTTYFIVISTWAAPNSVAYTLDITEILCADPSDLTVSAITTTSADLGWTENAGASSWNIELGTAGFVPTGVATATSATNPYPAMGLTENTAYDFYIQSDCGTSQSAWIGPLTFTTACTTFTAPYTEDFESAGALPSCWTLGGDDVWEFTDTGAEHIGDAGTLTGNTASDGFFAWLDDSDPTATNASLISPFVDVTGLTTPALSFYEVSNNEGANPNATLTVEVWDGAAWNVMGTYNTNTAGWELKVIDLSGLTFTGDAQARFLVADSGSFYDDIAIDDVTFDEAPSCFDPSMLTATNILTDSADLGWTENGSSTLWNIELVDITAMGTQTGNPTATGVANPYMATGLTSDNAYEFYVQADCGASGTSAWAGPFAFRTLCSVITPEYVADMSVNVPDSCWDEAGSGDATSGPMDLGSSDWRDGTSYALGSSNAINLYFNNDSEWLLSPTFDLSTGGPYQLEINVAVTNWNGGTTPDSMGSDDEVQLLMSTDGGTTWTNVTTWNAANEPPVGGIEYVEDLTAITGNVQFAVLATDGAIDDSEDYDFHVGKFRVREIPSCAEPTGLMAATTSITDVDISWTPGDTETDWTYEYGVSPYAQGGGGTSGTVMTTPSLSLSGLTEGETYDIYIQSNCGGSDSVYATLSWTQPISGATCEAAITVGALPYNTSDDTANYGDDYSGSAGATGCGTTSNYLNGDDVVYAYTATADTSINIALSALGGAWSGMFVYTDCANIGTECVAGMGNGSSTADYALDVDVLSGTTYYIVISTWPAPQSTTYTLDITENLCTGATVTIPADPIDFTNCPTTVDVSISIDDLGDSGTLTISAEDDMGNPAGTGGAVSATGIFTITNVPVPQTSWSITIAHESNTDCDVVLGPFVLDCPPANDDIAAAIAITVDEGFCDGTNTNGTNLYTSDSGEGAGSCFNGGVADDDVWFTFTVPSGTATVDVSTDFTGGTLLDSEIAVYSGTSGSLVELGCSQDEGTTILSNGFSWNSLITDLAVTVGETYYVQVAGYNANAGTFCLDVSTNQVLSTTDLENESAFTYYPNPVENTLTLNAQNTIENVTVFNVLGQEVLRAVPNAVDSELDMSNLQAGAYFVKVTIANVTKTVRVIKQ
ncbi:choice-of-anchor J domain-containing protein [uncultured Winogradskyella sp.]|uniref:T9SS-dependent choice-of-anchor J family protein n=1 Tax=uncultured Winogradskyella sp. TaxID=395353 RepID=UPI00262AE0C4|nr:choice-of-anchor J domain-containing protein [uncultured Winogradskyella sp.]